MDKSICSICLNASNSAQRQGGDKLTVPWWSFLGLRAEIDDIISHHQLQIDKDFFVSNEILELLTSKDPSSEVSRRTKS